jgi:CheY-like chemotaxis protein
VKRQKSVLIVEDENLLGELIQGLLEPYYEEVHFCPSPIKALELVKQRTFSIILCDIMMPGMAGHDFVTHLRSYGRIEPVIFVTGNVTREILLTAVRLGVSDVIEKPFEEAILLQAIERTLEIDKRRTALYESIFAHQLQESETDKQKRMIGLLQAVNSKKI